MLYNEKEIAYWLRELHGRFAIPRKKAAEALVKVGEAAVPGLIATLCDDNPDVQSAAAEALERIATPKALEAVQEWRDSQERMQS